MHAISAKTDLKTLVYFSYLLKVGGFWFCYRIVAGLSRWVSLLCWSFWKDTCKCWSSCC